MHIHGKTYKLIGYLPERSYMNEINFALFHNTSKGKANTWRVLNRYVLKRCRQESCLSIEEMFVYK